MTFRYMGGVNSELYSFFTLTVDGSDWSVSRRSEFIQGKTSRYALNGGLDKFQRYSGRCAGKVNFFLPSGFESRNVEPLAHHYPDQEIPACFF
jgi:hypothetical protein